MVGVGSNLGKNAIGVSETVPDCDSFETGQETTCFFGFNYLLSDSWNVLSCVALTENHQGVGGRDVEVERTETALSVV